MFFTKSKRFKPNFLIVMVGKQFDRIYKNYEYEVYDEVRKVFDEKGSADNSDVQTAIKSFREHVAMTMFDWVDNEYADSVNVARELMKDFYENNDYNICTTGPGATLVYSVIVKMVMGEGYDFKVIVPQSIPENQLNDDTPFEVLAGIVSNKIEESEAVAIRTSLEVMVDDGTVGSYPDYE